MAAKAPADYKEIMASLKRELDAIESGSFLPGPELKKLREENAKLRYQLNKLTTTLKPSDVASSDAIATNATSIDVAALLSSVNGPGNAIDICGVLIKLFQSAFDGAFPGIEFNINVSPNTLASGKKGGKTKGKGKGGKGNAASSAGDASKSPAPTYQCADAMKIFGKLKKLGVGDVKSPADVAERIVAHLPAAQGFIDRVEIGGGYMNIAICREFTNKQLTKVVTRGALPPQVKSQQVVVDFSSPNIAKIMHVGHLRSTILGESMCRLLEFLDHKVHRMNHVGDWGTQFGMLIANLKDKFPNFESEAPPIHDLLAFYKESKKRSDTEPDFKARAKLEVVALQKGEPAVTKAWKLICDVSRREYAQVYKRLDVKTHEQGESFYQSRMLELMDDLTRRGLIVRGQTYKVTVDDEMTVEDVEKAVAELSGIPAGARPIYFNEAELKPGKPLSEYGVTPDKGLNGEFHFMLRTPDGVDEPACAFLFASPDLNPLIVQKTDGGFGYHTSDLACIKYRVKELKADWMVYVVDAGQALHLQQVFSGAAKIGLPVCLGCVRRAQTGASLCVKCDGVRVDHTAFGVVQARTKDPETGKFKISKLKTREGDLVALQWLLDEGVKKAGEFRRKAAEERAARDKGAAAMELSEVEAAVSDEAIAYNCIKYADLSHDRVRDYVFDFDSMLSPKGDTAVYLNNAFARIQQVLMKPEVESIDIQQIALKTDIVTAKLPLKGIQMAEHLLRFPEKAFRAATYLMPNYLCEYLYELASMVHEFYADGDSYVIDKRAGTVHHDRVLLFAAAAVVMKKCFHLIGLRTVDKM